MSVGEGAKFGHVGVGEAGQRSDRRRADSFENGRKVLVLISRFGFGLSNFIEKYANELYLGIEGVKRETEKRGI